MAVNLNLGESVLGQGTVNYFGSSYSGADIKLIVHTSMYETFEEQRQQQLKEVERDMVSAQDQFEEYIPSARADALANIDNLSQQYASLAASTAPAPYVVIATAQTLSIQTFREKVAVRALGFVAPKGHVKGPRTVAGSIIFTVFDEHALAPLLHNSPTQFAHELANTRGGVKTYIDQLPPLTITALFANEYGSMSQLSIYGVEFVTDGMVMSIEDIFTENTCSFVAKDYDVLLKTGQVDLKKSRIGVNAMVPRSGSSLLESPEYADYKSRLGLMRDPYK